MPTLIEHLESFNRKERFFVVGAALGNPSFRLGQEFKSTLGAVFNFYVPHDAFAAMGYHLDWIHAALLLVGNDTDTIYSNDPTVVTGTRRTLTCSSHYRKEPLRIYCWLRRRPRPGGLTSQCCRKPRVCCGFLARRDWNTQTLDPISH